MQVKTQGLIIKEQTIGESDRLVTVLTKDAGVLRAFARKAKSLKDSKSAATQLLCYSRLSVFKGREKYIIDDAEPIDDEIIEEDETMEKTMKIEGMMCCHCEARVKKILEALDGVSAAVVSHTAGTAVLTLTKDVDNAVLTKAIEDQDYKVLGIE